MLHVIYIPGLGDSRVRQTANGQRLLVGSWRVWRVHPHVFQMNWADGEAFAPKFERLLALVDELSQDGSVGLVAASAGASVALNVYAERPRQIRGIVCIAGKINNPQAIGDSYKIKNPAFWESAQRSVASLAALSAQQRRRIVSIRALVDIIVPPRDSYLEGANNRVVPMIGHSVTIASQLVFGAPFFLRFLKQRAKQL